MCITLVVHFTDCDTRRQSTINTEVVNSSSATRSSSCPYHKFCSPGKLRICPFAQSDKPCPDGDVYHHILPSILKDLSLGLAGELSDVDDWSAMKLKPELQHGAMDLRDYFFVGRLKLWLLASQGTKIVNHLDGGRFMGSAWEEACLVQEHGVLCAQWTTRRDNLLGLLGAWEKLASYGFLEPSPRAVAVHQSGYVHEEVEDFPRFKGQGTPFKWMDNILIQDALLVNYPHYARQARGNLRWDRAQSRREQVEQWWGSHCPPSGQQSNFGAAVARAAATIRQFNDGAAPWPHPAETPAHENPVSDYHPEHRSLSPMERLLSPLPRSREQSEGIEFAPVNWDEPAGTTASVQVSPQSSTRTIPGVSAEDQRFVHLQSQFPPSADRSEDRSSDVHEADATIEELGLSDHSEDPFDDLYSVTDGESDLGNPSKDPFDDRFKVDEPIGEIDLGDRSENPFDDVHKADAPNGEIDLEDPFRDLDGLVMSMGELNLGELELGDPNDLPQTDRESPREEPTLVEFPSLEDIMDFWMAGPPNCLEQQTYFHGRYCEEPMPIEPEAAKSLKRKRDESDAGGETQKKLEL